MTWPIAIVMMVMLLAAYAGAEPTTRPTAQPTLVDLPAMELAGIATFGSPKDGLFGRLWHDWQQNIDNQPGLGDGKYAYGVSLIVPTSEKNMQWSYLAALQVTDPAKAPAFALRLPVPAGQWAVFKLSKGMPDGLAELGPMFDYIYKDWLPASGYARTLPMNIERYNSKENTIEILIAVKKKTP